MKDAALLDEESDNIPNELNHLLVLNVFQLAIARFVATASRERAGIYC